MASGKNTNDLRSYIKEYEIKTGTKLDVILVDYLDLMMPISRKVSPSDLFVKDKHSWSQRKYVEFHDLFLQPLN